MEEKDLKQKSVDQKEGLTKARKFCAYQERSQQQLRDKLYELGVKTPDVEQIISDMISEGFLNEERFARSFAGGKFRIKKWGRVKIASELKKHGVSAACISKGLKEIDDREYHKALKEELHFKMKNTSEKNPLKKKYKVVRYLVSRGYESDLIWDLFKDED